MPENDAQKKELEQSEPTEQLTEQDAATGEAGQPGTGASTDAQKKEIHEV